MLELRPGFRTREAPEHCRCLLAQVRFRVLQALSNANGSLRNVELSQAAHGLEAHLPISVAERLDERAGIQAFGLAEPQGLGGTFAYRPFAIAEGAHECGDSPRRA